MKKYIGTKLISATPMSSDQHAGAINKGDLSKLSGGIDQDGYRVVYEDGYVSWSPKDVFEKAYKVAETWQDRVIIEINDLTKKCKDLEKALIENTVPLEERPFLQDQFGYMNKYLSILHTRIQRDIAFNKLGKLKDCASCKHETSPFCIDCNTDNFPKWESK